MKVFLSGGLRSGWQDKAIAMRGEIPVTELMFFDPRCIASDNPKHFTYYNMYNAMNCDFVLAYLECDNPSGLGLSMEIGAAFAMGVPVVLVTDPEHKYKNKELWEKHQRYMPMQREIADAEFNSIEEGMNFILSFVE